MERLSLSLPDHITTQVRHIAEEDGATISAWVAHAIETQILLRNGRKAVAAWEKEHGEITEEMMDIVEKRWLE